MQKLTFFLFALLLSGCGQKPEGAKTITDFNLQKYTGLWYEIARLDHRFERGLSKVTAEYAVRTDGKIAVHNKGYNDKEGKWESATGKARPASEPNIGELEVSFFGPFYSGYNIIALDSDYQYALVAGENLKYLWILARQPSIPDDIRSRYLEIAKKVGYKVAELIWVKQN